MNKSCLTFSKLSDLYDNDLATHEEKEDSLHHLDDCTSCNVEYDRLRKTVILVSYLKHQDFNLCQLSDKTIKIFKTSKRKKQIFRYLPSVAASVIIVSSVWIATTYNSGSFNVNLADDRSNSAIPGISVSKGKISKQEKIVNIVSDMKAKVLKVSEHYVEGEISYNRFKALYRNLGHNGFQKVKFKVVSGSDLSINSGSGHNFKSNFEEVSAGDIALSHSDSDKIGTSVKEKSIRFRVYP